MLNVLYSIDQTQDNMKVLFIRAYTVTTLLLKTFT